MIISWRGTDINISEVSLKREAVFSDDRKAAIGYKITIIGYDYDTRTVDTGSAPNNIPDTDSET